MEQRHGYTSSPTERLLSNQLPSFEQISAERSYLFNILQHEDFKAIGLLKHIQMIEEELRNGLCEKPARKARQRLGWLKHRMGECTKQERSILAGLGQVTCETQVTGRNFRTEYERLQCLRDDRFQRQQLDPFCLVFTPSCSPHEQLPDQSQGVNCSSSLQNQQPLLSPAQDLPSIVTSLRVMRPRAASVNNLCQVIEKEKRWSMPDLCREKNNGAGDR